MDERDLSVNALALQVPCDKALISRYRSGAQPPSMRMARRLDEVLDAGGQLSVLARPQDRPASSAVLACDDGLDDEIAALELARRAAASDVGLATVERL